MGLNLRFGSLSLGASVDQQTGSLSVFDVVEEIRVPQTPFHLQNLVISLALEKDDESDFEGQVFIHHLPADGTRKAVGNGPLKVPKDQKRVKAVFRFGGFPIADFGQHRIVVSWVGADGKKQGEAIFDFDVIQVVQQAQAQAPTKDEGKPKVTH